MEILGIDIGGTGIKGALVETTTGELLTERYRILTPHPAKPNAVCDAVVEVIDHFGWTGPVGCTFPALIRHDIIQNAANISQSWIGKNARELFQQKLDGPLRVLNDADAAGIAEMTFGAGQGEQGLVMMLTFGTGIGSALFFNGQLIPNAELGHLEIRGQDAERRASDHVRQAKKLSWKKWAKRVDEYLARLEFYLSPDLFIIGGGVSKNHDKFLPRLHTHAPIKLAQFLNEAGIVGAALAAAASLADAD